MITQINNWTRICPNCKKLISYTTKGSIFRANQQNSLCKNCFVIVNRLPRQRMCPSCKKQIFYSNRDACRRANQKNLICKLCSAKLRMVPKILERNCPLCNKIIVYVHNSYRKAADKKEALCRSCSRSGERSSLWGRSHSRKAIKNMRLAYLNAITNRHGQIAPNYNPKACKMFNLLDKMTGWHGKHAENGGEFYIKGLGYWVDYYEPVHNIVIEYDEVYHNQEKQKRKDVLRQKDIINILKCKFYRYSEKYNMLYEVK